MTRFTIEFKGYIEVDKEDLKIQRIDEEGNMINVNPNDLTSEEILNGIRKGDFYISFVECYQQALDGSEEFEVEYEEEDYGE